MGFFTIILGLLQVRKIGRTVPSFRPALEHEIESWKDFKRALRAEDQRIFDKIMNFARIHADAGSMSARPMLSEILFMSFAIEQQKEIQYMKEKVEALLGEQEK
ncbi:MAG: hypothetical protein ACTSR8_03160 [Promethearchaeota archaeon]